MKRRALIIGNSGKNSDNQYLGGVEKDVSNINKFLLLNIGGKWNEDEIIISLDESKNIIDAYIEQIKNEYNDYVLIVFSGHGAYSQRKECRMLEIGNDILYEDELLYLSQKQIIVFDTCASLEKDLLIESAMESIKFDSISFINRNIDYRKKFETEILKSPKQQNILYSSSIDESSEDDTELGGYFIYELLKSAKNNTQDVLNIKSAFFEAKSKVQEKTRYEQNPQMKSSKLKNGYLPFSIKEY
jgi:hypothetical protein